MKTMTLAIAFALSVAVALSGQPVSAAQHEGTKPDNSRMNKEENKGLTAEQQKETDSDREITRKIRRAVVKEKGLSTTAKNVKIITQDGKVTLKGPVRSEQEKQTIQKAAEQVAPGQVTNELKVAPKKDKKEKEKTDKQESEKAKEKAPEKP